MNKNVTPIILLILAIGIYFTFTKGKIDEIKSIKEVNAGYQQAIDNSEKLVKIRDGVLKSYNEIGDDDKDRLNKMLPNNIDNVRLTLDVKSIGLGRGLVLKNVKTNAPNINTSINKSTENLSSGLNTPIMQDNLSKNYNTVILSFNVSTDYATFLGLLRDLEASLRIIDISKVSFTAGDNSFYDFSVELKTYWLKQ